MFMFDWFRSLRLPILLWPLILNLCRMKTLLWLRQKFIKVEQTINRMVALQRQQCRHIENTDAVYIFESSLISFLFFTILLLKFNQQNLDYFLVPGIRAGVCVLLWNFSFYFIIFLRLILALDSLRMLLC